METHSENLSTRRYKSMQQGCISLYLPSLTSQKLALPQHLDVFLNNCTTCSDVLVNVKQLALWEKKKQNKS